ncbi:MAG TPA: quinoprotein relay system zinc metallohydrolase 2 [Geminicoccaceae bacterium]|nr:quinoprotein relay system zinc metallohydrolase 2 [Geminicoccaceae bacterium]
MREPRLSRREALALGAGGLLAASGLGTQRSAAAATPLSVSEIAPGVFVHRGVHERATPENLGAIANVGFVVGDEAVAVIDSGGCARAGARLHAAIRRITDLPVRYVIASHVHPDHLFGHAAFAPEAPVFVGHAKLPAALAMRGAYYLDDLRASFGPLAEGTEVVAPTMVVRDRAELDLGGRTLALVAHPTAHTDNDLSVFDEATGTLWLADLLFMERLPVIDGSLLGWLDVLETVRAWPAERVVPGHGPASAPWPDAAAAQVRYLERLRDEIRAVIAQAGTIEEAVATVGAAERGSWRLFELDHPRNVTAAFAELEWE